MKVRGWTGLGVAVLAVGAGLATSQDCRGEGPPVSLRRLERQIHELVNRERQKQGLKPLELDPRLAEIARGHSEDMAKRNYFGHQSPEGLSPTDRGKIAGYPLRKKLGRGYTEGLAENVFKGTLYRSMTRMLGLTRYHWMTESELANKIVAGWMKSPGHRKNILTATYDKEGIGAGVSKAGYELYVTQVFW